jgi:hypothetical protein
MDGFQPCAHCAGKGTCRNGPEEGGCQICFAHWRERYPKTKDNPQVGAIKCSTCWGRGIVEPPGATKWDYKTPAYLGGLLALCSFALLFTLAFRRDPEGFSKSLVFVGTLLGSITGYYFGGQKRVPAKTGDDAKSGDPAVAPTEK